MSIDSFSSSAPGKLCFVIVAFPGGLHFYFHKSFNDYVRVNAAPLLVGAIKDIQIRCVSVISFITDKRLGIRKPSTLNLFIPTLDTTTKSAIMTI